MSLCLLTQKRNKSLVSELFEVGVTDSQLQVVSLVPLPAAIETLSVYYDARLNAQSYY